MSGGSTQTSTSTTSTPEWMQKYQNGLVDTAWNQAQQPYTPYGGDYAAGMNGYQQQGIDALANRAASGSATMGAANNTLQGVMNNPGSSAVANPYANINNPYLDQSIANAQGDLVKSWNNVQLPAWQKAMAGGGSFGNTGVEQATQSAQDDLQKNLGRVATDARMGAYNTAAGLQDSQASRVMQALGMAPTMANQDYTDINNLISAGTQLQGQNQAQIDAAKQQYLDQQNYPRNNLQWMGNMLGLGGNGNSSTTQTQPGASTASQVTGGALTGAALYQMLFGG